jgi:hypothetical protein
MFSFPLVYEQSVYKLSLTRDAQINTYFSIYDPIFMNSFLSQTDRCSWLLFLGSTGKLIFVLWVFALQAVLEEQIEFVNWRITVFIKTSLHHQILLLLWYVKQI